MQLPLLKLSSINRLAVGTALNEAFIASPLRLREHYGKEDRKFVRAEDTVKGYELPFSRLHTTAAVINSIQ